MLDMATARRMMVDGQVRTADVTDLGLIAAMLAVPRELFVPGSSGDLAYLDRDIPVAEGRALLKPMVLAKLIQAADVQGSDRVLDVGCASGYSSAVLARLAGAVIALEQDAGLAGQAAKAFAALGLANVALRTGPLAAGWPDSAPYDVIVLNGATDFLPEELGRQLAAGGRLVCIRGRGPAGKAMIYRPSEGELSGRPLFDASAPLLPGFAMPPAFTF
jgi:protein-L-isoaspartate(D-aspartate) O-methyltransferase